MNSYHVYYNELFKQGKVELLVLIKRKISDTPSSPTSSDYQPAQSFSSSKHNNHDLSYENMMLKKLNQKAVNRINTLEAKIADLVHENKVMLRKINDKEKKEEYLHSAFSHCYQPQQPINQGYLQPTMQMYAPYPQTMVKSEFQVVQMSTPETDYTSSPDTYLGYENEATSGDSTDFQSNNNYDQSVNSYQFYEDSSYLGKRSLKSENLPWEDDINLKCEPAKLQCFGLFEEQDKRINLLDPEFPVFSQNLVDGAF